MTIWTIATSALLFCGSVLHAIDRKTTDFAEGLGRIVSYSTLATGSSVLGGVAFFSGTFMPSMLPYREQLTLLGFGFLILALGLRYQVERIYAHREDLKMADVTAKYIEAATENMVRFGEVMNTLNQAHEKSSADK